VSLPLDPISQQTSYSQQMSYSSSKGDKTGEEVAGALLIILTDAAVGLPAAALIIGGGGITPPAILGEVLETFVVLPVTLFGIYLIYDATR